MALVPSTSVGGGSSSAGALTQIYDNVASGAIASWDVTGIPGTYTHLQVRLHLRGDAAGNAVNGQMRINGDASAIYDNEYVHGANATPTAGNLMAQTSFFIGFVVAASAAANYAGGIVIDLNNYANATLTKHFVANGVTIPTTAAADAGRTSSGGMWRSTAAITQLTVFPASGNFVAGSRITIYGLT